MFKKARGNRTTSDELDLKSGKPFLKFCKRNAALILAFLIPVAIMTGIYISTGVYPFGSNCYLPSDMYAQYAPFFSELRQKLISGGSLLYTWNMGMGSNFTAVYAYYLSSPINWILAFVPHGHIIDVMDAMIALKIGLLGFTFAYYLYRHFKTRHIFIAAFAVFYALSSYVAAFRWNIMWLDCLVMLPLILLGLERLVKKNHCFLYCTALGISIFCNYYISIMICVFCVLYFIVLLILEDGIKEKHFFAKRIRNFVIFSALAGGFAACLMMPEMFALKLAASGTIKFPQTLETYYSFFDLIPRAMLGVKPQILEGHLPNIYCTVAVFLLVPLYWFNKTVPLKEKICKSTLLVFMLISFNVNILDFVWHGCHFPNCLQCRQSFIYIFLILTISFEGMRGFKQYTISQLSVTCAGIAGLLVIYKVWLAKETLTAATILMTAAFIVGYFLLIIFLRKSKSKLMRNILLWSVLAVVIAEASINIDITAVNATSRTAYLSDNAAIAELLEDVNKEDPGFYRIEKDERRTPNDGAWNQYKGVSSFSSTANSGLTNLLGALGLEHSVNKYSFNGYTPLTMSLLSVKYVLYNHAPNDDLTSFYAKSGDQSLYKNNYFLPLGFMLDSKWAASWSTAAGNPFIVQNNFAEEVTGLSGLFEPVKSTKVDHSTVLNISDNKTVYLYLLPNSGVKSVKVTIKKPDGSEGKTKIFPNLRRSYILNLGSSSPGSEITILVDSENSAEFSLFAYSFNDEIYKKVIDQLNEQPFTVEAFHDTYVKGSITALSDGLMYTSIPYDDGWIAFVDGKKTKIKAFKDAFISVPLSSGSHIIEFYYFPAGLKVGIILSLSCLLIFALIVINKRKDRNKSSKPDNREGYEAFSGTDPEDAVPILKAVAILTTEEGAAAEGEGERKSGTEEDEEKYK